MIQQAQTEERVPSSRGVLYKFLAAIYIGGAYGLILISLVQALVIFSWLRT
ncbi:MAG: hypothetical protein HQL56_03330 [Magnetococcales bacterium]|nr:hypothetical protein [Magnetococcales bacterium]